MNGRTAVRVLLCVMLAGLSGALVSCKSTPKGPPAVADGLKVTLDMTVTLPDKTVVSTVGKAPITFVQGKHDIWPSLEIALAGMRPGEKKNLALTSDQAAGPYDENKRRTVKMEQLPPGSKVGTKVRSKDGAIARIVKLSGDTAEIDFNDPLAGKDLLIEATIVKVEKP